MSTSPKVAGLPNPIIYGFIAGAVLILLLCGGAAFYFLIFKEGTGGGSGTAVGKAVSVEDAIKSAELMVKDISREDYEHALKFRSTAALRRKYTPDELKELVEKGGKGLINMTNWHFKQVGQTPNSVKLMGQAGGGPYGATTFELVLMDDGDGVKVSELSFK